MTRLANQQSKQTDGLGNNKKREMAINAISELGAALNKLRENHNTLVRISNTSAQKTQDQIDDIAIVLSALTKIVGKEKVEEEARAIRIGVLEKGAKEDKTAIDNALTEGKLAKTDSVAENTLVGISSKNKDGGVMYPSVTYAQFEILKPEVQAILKGKAVGDTVIDPSNGNTMEVVEIYVEAQPAPDNTQGETPQS